MTKKKNNLLRNASIIAGIVVFVGVVITSAASLSLKESIANKTSEVLAVLLHRDLQEEVIEADENLGGSGGVFQTDWFKVGNRVTWIKSGQFVDKSVVLFSFLNPVDYGKATSTSDATYNAATHESSTSTVLSVNLDITGAATSSMRIVCGGASSATATPTYELLDMQYATNTLGVFNNDMATTSGFALTDGDGVSKILLTHDYNYFNCIATSTANNWGLYGEAITGGANTFNGFWSVEVIKNLQ